MQCWLPVWQCIEFKLCWHCTVVSSSVCPCVVIIFPGFDLPRHTWSLLNRFRTDQGPCRANLHKWGLAQSPSCDCGQRQTMCPLTKFEGGLNLLHEADDDAVIWLEPQQLQHSRNEWNDLTSVSLGKFTNCLTDIMLSPRVTEKILAVALLIQLSNVEIFY